MKVFKVKYFQNFNSFIDLFRFQSVRVQMFRFMVLIRYIAPYLFYKVYYICSIGITSIEPCQLVNFAYK